MATVEIDDNDKQFLPHLGKGTDIITNFDDWRKATHSHVGKTTRKVQEDYSNVEPRTHGEEILSKQEDHTRDKSLSVSAKVKASAPAAVGIPAGGSVKAGGSQSRTLSSMQSEHSVIIRTLAFKDETPSFPTDIEKDMCKYVVEWLKMHQSSATSSLGSSSSVKIEAVCVEDNDSVKRFNRYIDQLNAGEWDDLSDAITSYLATTKVTHYVCSITLGAKQYETVESIQASTEIVGGVGVDAANVAGAGTKGKLSSGLENKSRQTIKLGGHREFPESKDENVAIVKVGISPISELVEDPRVKAILDRAVKHYHEQKQRRKDKADSGICRIIIAALNAFKPIPG